MFRSHCFSLTLTCLQNTYISLFVGSLESSEWSSPDNANTTGAAIIIITRRVPVEQEIINVYDVFEIYDHTILHFTHIFFAPGHRPVPRWGAYNTAQTPSWSARHLRWLRHSHIQNITLISDHSLAALHLSCRHLAINLPLAQRIGEEIPHYLSFFIVKTKYNKTQKAVAQRSRIGEM